jgi:exodeoxyribonuclease VII small subunit
VTENASRERAATAAPDAARPAAAGDAPPAVAGSAGVSTLAFDRALEELRDVVVRLEDGGLPLEESIALYERGVALHEHCGTLLQAAELRVQRLVDAAGGSTRTLDLRPGDEDDEA